MKKIYPLLILIVACVGCDRNMKKEQDQVQAELQHTIETWQYAIRTQSFKVFKETEHTPGNDEKFSEDYNEFYYKNIMILSYTPPEKKIVDGGEYNTTTVTIAAEVINRSDESSQGMVNGTLRLIAPPQEKSVWKIYDTLLMHNM